MAKGTRPNTTRMEKGKRSPTAHRTLEQAQKQSAGYEAQPHRRKYRTALGKLREEYGLKKGDGKEVSHKKAASKGGAHTKANTTVTSRTTNRKRGAK